MIAVHGMRDLPPPQINPYSPKWKQSLNHWTTREVPGSLFNQSDSTLSCLARTLVSITLGGLVGKWCPALCDPMDCSLPGFSVRGIFQARVLEWVVISFSRGSAWPRNRIQVSCTAGRFFFFYRLSYQGILSIILMAGEGNGNPLQYSCLENPTDRGAWQATVYAVAECQTWLRD